LNGSESGELRSDKYRRASDKRRYLMGGIISLNPLNDVLFESCNFQTLSSSKLGRDTVTVDVNTRREGFFEFGDRLDDSIISSGRSHLMSELHGNTTALHDEDTEAFLIEKALQYFNMTAGDSRVKSVLYKVMLPALRMFNFSPNTIIMNQGDNGTNLYIIESGKVKVTMNGTFVCEIERGALFGELSLLFNYPRSATFISVEKCRAWSLDRKTFAAIQKELLSSTNSLLARRFLDVPEVAMISNEYLQRLVSKLSSSRYAAGQEIMVTGKCCSRILVIEDGTIDIIISPSLQKLSRAQLIAALNISVDFVSMCKGNLEIASLSSDEHWDILFNSIELGISVNDGFSAAVAAANRKEIETLAMITSQTQSQEADLEMQREANLGSVKHRSTHDRLIRQDAGLDSMRPTTATLGQKDLSSRIMARALTDRDKSVRIPHDRTPLTDRGRAVSVCRKHQALERKESLTMSTRPSTNRIRGNEGDNSDKFNSFLNRIGSATDSRSKPVPGSISLRIPNKPFKGLSDELERSDYKSSRSLRISKPSCSSPSTPPLRKTSSVVEPVKEDSSVGSEIHLKAVVTSSAGVGSGVSMIRPLPHNGLHHLSPLPPYNEYESALLLESFKSLGMEKVDSSSGNTSAGNSYPRKKDKSEKGSLSPLKSTCTDCSDSIKEPAVTVDGEKRSDEAKAASLLSLPLWQMKKDLSSVLETSEDLSEKMANSYPYLSTNVGELTTATSRFINIVQHSSGTPRRLSPILAVPGELPIIDHIQRVLSSSLTPVSVRYMFVYM
jgi:hypothetical protein